MPTPRRTSQRARRNSWRKDNTSDQQLPDSSPSRPAKRRKQIDESPRDIPEEEPSSLVADSSAINLTDETQIVTRVTQNLTTASGEPVRASKDHSNAIHEANKEGVQAYAKIAAQDWTFYVTKVTINIGRISEPPPEYPENYDPETDPDFVHIDLGPSKWVSRQHAQIIFNTKSERWFLHVKGRNGVKVNKEAWRVGQSKPLDSGDVIEIGDVEMMFVLPPETSPLRIHNIYLQRSGIPKTELAASALEETPVRHRLRATTPIAPTESSPRGSATRSALPRGQPTPQAIAPAPPDYKRPGTPPSARSRASASGSLMKSPQFANMTSSQFQDIPGIAVNPNEVDLSLDENKNLKPQYSYAQMITQAIMNTSDGKLNLNGIYNFIMDNYSYYKHQQAAGWQNSIRHNLSLNKAFEKVARSTEEPGKGMKWYILPEYKEEMVRTAYRGGRGGHRGSSNPSSPNQLNYVNQGIRDMAARDHGSVRKRRVSPSGSPQPRPTLRDMHMTPDRSSRRLLPDEAPASSDGSPLPRYRRSAAANKSAVGSSMNTSSLPTVVETAPQSPTLTSTFLQDESISSFVTPAPHRVNLKLNPPSTLQRPSQHMPTSSPAPFWKYADIGSTPLKATASFDFSPSKGLGLGSGLGSALPASSSPPPGATRANSPMSSPTRARSASQDLAAVTGVQTPADATADAAADVPADVAADAAAKASSGVPLASSNPADAAAAPVEPASSTDAAVQPDAVDDEEDGGFDLTKGFQSIGSYHAPVRHGLPVATAMNGNQ